VFDKYLGTNKSAYIVREEETSIKDAVDIIHKAGSISFLAHPELFGRENSTELVRLFKEAKGDGIETYYPYHIICPDLKINEKENDKIIEFYKNIAEEEGFIESGGSDFHGGERMTMGKLDIIRKKLTKI